MKRLLTIVPLIFFCHASPVTTNIQFAIGPGWNNFLSDVRFNITSPFAALGKSVYVTNFDLMAWLQGRIQNYIGSHLLIDTTIGGGLLHRRRGVFRSDAIVVDEPFVSHFQEYDINVNSQLFSLYIGAGGHWMIHDCFHMASTAGFALRLEDRHFMFVQLPNRVTIKTDWYGGYIGLEGELTTSERTTFLANYKLVLGNAISKERLSINCINEYECARAPFFCGNDLTIQWKYLISDCWFTGIAFNYATYQMFGSGYARLPAVDRDTETNPSLQFLQSNLASLTGFIGASF